MSDTVVHRDERTIAVENASCRWGYTTMTFGLLLVVMYRSFLYQEAPWDLLGLVILGGLVSAGYQGFRHVLTGRWAVVTALTMLLSGLVAAVVAALR